MSEKIFDCFCARTVPIYYGSKGNEAFLPKGTYIDFRDFATLAHLLRYLRNMDEYAYSQYISRINAFLQSPEVSQFSMQSLYKIIYEKLFAEG